MNIRNSATAGALVLALGVAGGTQAGTLEDVQARGVLNCVVSTGIAGFAYPDDAGEWHGFDIDFCRATAAAVLGDPTAIKAVTSTGKTRFTKLNAAEGDVLWRNTTITFSRDVGVKLRFHGVNYYDGQGFMVRKDLGVSSATELDGASICIQTGTTTELNLADYFHSNGMKYEAVTIETNDEARQNYTAGRCDVYTTDASGLAATRSTFTDPDNHVILPEIISKEPLGPALPPWRRPVVRHRDVGAERNRHGGGEGGHLGERRRHEGKLQGSRSPASAGRRRQSGCGAWPERRLGLQHHQVGRKLRGNLRAQHRRGYTDWPCARPQCAVDRRRPAILAAVPLSVGPTRA